jgi:tetratricopeptide (TPR) repeat protein
LDQLEPYSEPLAVVAQHWLGIAYMLQGQYRPAEELMQSALARLQRGQPTQSAAYVLRNLGDLTAAMGDLPLAQAYFAEAMAQFKHVGHGWEDATAIVWSPGDIARVLGDFAEAERLLTSALAATRRLRIWLRAASNLYRLGRLRSDQGRHGEAEVLLREALSLARESDYRFGEAQALGQLGHTTAALDRPEIARTYYTEALQIAQDESIDRIAVDILVGIAGLLAQDSDVEHAVGLLALAEDHSASDYETKTKAQRLLSQLVRGLTPDVAEQAMARGKSADLHVVVARFIVAGASGWATARRAPGQNRVLG